MSLIRPDFRCTEIVKYELIVPSIEVTSLIRPDFRCTKTVKYELIVP